jgi:hypothetical protein
LIINRAHLKVAGVKAWSCLAAREDAAALAGMKQVKKKSECVLHGIMLIYGPVSNG